MLSSVETVAPASLTVTQYAARLESAVLGVGSGTLEGEVQKATRRGNGMLWFDLTDGESTLACKVFSRDAGRLEHIPRDGDLVRVSVDRPDFWKARGSLSLIVSGVSLAGEGELLRQRAMLLARLHAAGLCDRDRWRPLPAFPRAVGVIAGEGSDGMSDVLRALADRWPSGHVVGCASLVQGKSAPRQLIDALATLTEHPRVDVIVMARGGGSVQDLACFDDERLCRALSASPVPVVCAIGHTDNNPVCNHVTWAAYTPSRSAEMVVPSARELHAGVSGAGRAIAGAAERVDLARERLDSCRAQLTASRLLAGRYTAVQTAAAVVDRSGRRLAELAAHVRDTGARVRLGVRHQIGGQERDCLAATARLVREAAAGATRREARARELVSREAEASREAAERRLDRAQRDVIHAAALVAARDLRRAGWLLASSGAGGAPIRSVHELAAGDRVDLHLSDGRAVAVIQSTTPDPGSRP